MYLPWLKEKQNRSGPWCVRPQNGQCPFGRPTEFKFLAAFPLSVSSLTLFILHLQGPQILQKCVFG